MRATVIITDVVNSRLLGDEVLRAVRDTILQAYDRAHTHLVATPEATLGDEVQAAVETPLDAVNAIIATEEAILGLGTDVAVRTAMVVGEVEGLRRGARLTERSGGAIVRARRLVDEMRSKERRGPDGRPYGRLRADLGSNEASASLNDAFLCWSGIVDAWPSRYHKIALALTDGGSDAEVAEAFGMTRSAIWKRRQALGIDQYLACRRLLPHLVTRSSLTALMEVAS